MGKIVNRCSRTQGATDARVWNAGEIGGTGSGRFIGDWWGITEQAKASAREGEGDQREEKGNGGSCSGVRVSLTMGE